MQVHDELFRAAIERFDAANSEDPTRVLVDGVQTPGELVYARRMTAWLERLYPGASEALRLAARAQHIRRWEIPRNTYPIDRTGYHRWRTSLYIFHADAAAKILAEVGYREDVIARVRSLLRKERLKADAESQALEDVACLVFLENYFAEFALKHDEGKVIGILRRTWGKMSERGREAAVRIPLEGKARKLVERALASS